MDLTAARAEWEKLHMDWVFANQMARKRELENTRLFIECAARRGSGPSPEDLEAADRLRRAADDVKEVADKLIRETFG